MRFITLTVVAAVLIEGYLSASLNGPLEDSKKVEKRQAPFFPNFVPSHMGGFRPNMGSPGMMPPQIGGVHPNMGPPPGMIPPHMGGFHPNMGPPSMMSPNRLPPNMFHPPNENFANAQVSNSSDGTSFGYGYSYSNGTDQNENPVSSGVVTDSAGNRTEYNP